MKKFIFSTVAIFLLANVAYSQCEPVSAFPWSEGFEDNGTNFPKCWNQEGYGWQWSVVPASIGIPDTAYSGNYKAQIFLDFFGLPVYAAKLITPTFDLSTVDKPILSFWHTQTGPCQLVVLCKNSPNGEWVLLKSFYIWDVGDIPDWQEEIILLPEKSDDYKIAFEGIFLGGGIADLQLDGISIFDEEKVSIKPFGTPAINIYPNPTKRELRVVSNELKIENIEIYDIFGKKVNITRETIIDISHLATGVYFVKVITDVGVVVKKMVKE